MSLLILFIKNNIVMVFLKWTAIILIIFLTKSLSLSIKLDIITIKANGRV